MQLYFQLNNMGKATTLGQPATRNVTVVADIIVNGTSA